MKFVQKKIRIMFRKIGKKYAMSSIGSLIWLNENKTSEIGVGFVERVIKFYCDFYETYGVHNIS